MDTMQEGNMAPPRSWWSRNWKWAVPVGCLGLVASCMCFGVLAIGTGISAIKNNDAYEQAMDIALSDDEVRAELGTPIDTGWTQQLSLKTENGQTSARFSIPLEGTRAAGTLRVEAIKNGETWEYQVFQVDMPGRPSIDLRDKVGGGTQRERELAPPTPDTPPPAVQDEDAPAENGTDEGAGKPDIDL